MKNKNKRNGQKFEDKVRNTINSGALSFDKGDLKNDEYVIECKVTSKLGFRVSTKIVEKLWKQALESNKLPKLIIGIVRNDNERFILTCNIEIQNR